MLTEGVVVRCWLALIRSATTWPATRAANRSATSEQHDQQEDREEELEQPDHVSTARAIA